MVAVPSHRPEKRRAAFGSETGQQAQATQGGPGRQASEGQHENRDEPGARWKATISQEHALVQSRPGCRVEETVPEREGSGKVMP